VPLHCYRSSPRSLWAHLTGAKAGDELSHAKIGAAIGTAAMNQELIPKKKAASPHWDSPAIKNCVIR